MLNQRDTIYNKKLVDNTLHSVWGDHAAKEESPHGEFVQMLKTAAYIASSGQAILWSACTFFDAAKSGLLSIFNYRPWETHTWLSVI